MKKGMLLLALTLLICGVMQGQVGTRTLYDSTQVKMEESGLSHVYAHKLVRMENNRGCTAFNVIKLDYDPQSAYVEFKNVIVHHKNGKKDTVIYNGKGKVYDYTAPARLIYWGAKQKMVEVGHLNAGDEVEYSTYRKGFTYALLCDNNDKYIPPMRGHFYDIVPFWSDAPIDLKCYTITLPNTKTLQYKAYNGKVQTTSQKTAKHTTYTFYKENIKPLKAEQGMLAHNDIECKLLLSTSPNWEAKSVWFYKVNENYGSFHSTPELQRQVDIILAKAHNEDDSISLLTHWVADNMRYAGISMGKGEGYTLHNAKMNLTDRCGVCKDKAGLLVAMLRAAGFRSYAAMTMAGERIDRIPADQFNHSVCVVERSNGKYQLLDPTWVPNVRELWSSAEQQQGYLMGLPGGADLMETPISPAENHYIDITAETQIARNGTLSGRLTIRAEGQSDAAVRRIFRRQNDWRAALETELLKICPQANITEIRYTKPENYLLQPVEITYQFEIPNYAIVSKNSTLFIPISFRNIFSRAMTHLNFDTSNQTKSQPFADACSRMVRMSEHIKLPYRYRSIDYPQYQKIDSPTGNCEMSCEFDSEGDALTVKQTITLNKRKYEASEWPTFRKIVENQKQMSVKPLVVKDGSSVTYDWF